MSAVSEPSAASPAPGARPLTGDRILLLLRAGLALVLGLVITFSPDHSAGFGAVAFAVFAIATGAVQLVGARGGRTALAEGAAGIALGAGLLLLGPVAFVSVVSGWALLTGGLEIIRGIRERRRGGGAGMNSFIVGGLLVLLAAAVLLVPPDYAQPWQVIGDEGLEAEGSVTADIMTVGILGAWAVVHGVLLVIAALTPPRPAEPRP